jgi:5-methylcytosine-specific restriction protein A
MPRKPSVRCKHQGCTELVELPRRFCKEHQQQRWRAEKTLYTNDLFYKSSHWKRLRNMFIQSNPICNMCGKEGKVVDHIRARSMGGHDYEWANLQTLCRSCDQIKRGKEAQTLRAKGDNF